MTDLERDDFVSLGIMHVANHTRTRPTHDHLAAVYEYAQGASAITQEIEFALRTVCGWIYRDERPSFSYSLASHFERVLSAAWARLALTQWQTVTAFELACLTGRTYDAIAKRLQNGQLAGVHSAIDPVTARKYAQSCDVNL